MGSDLINEGNKMFAFLKKGFFPKAVFVGPMQNYFKTLEKKKCFVIASKEAFEGSAEPLRTVLDIGEKAVFFVEGEPSQASLEECKKQIESLGEFDFVLGFGGGSALDLAKAVKRELGLEMAAVPTTPGTGSEASPYAVLTKEGKKVVLSGQGIMPETVVLDAGPLKSIPKDLLGFMAMDALGHSIEALLSRAANPVSDALASKAAQMIFSASKQEEEKLQTLQAAGFLAGIAQGMAATGLAHAMAHALGPKLGLGHAKAVSLFLKGAVELNLENSNAGEKLERVGLSKEKILEGIDETARGFSVELKAVEAEKGFDFKEAVQEIKKDVCILTNPFRPDDGQIEEILRKAVKEKE